MTVGFIKVPNELIQICNTTVQKQDIFLCLRLYNAASQLVDVDDENISNAAKAALSILKGVKLVDFH